MSDITRDVARTIGKHFVSLSCVQRPPKSASKILVFSGFVIEILGEWFYVTAGHIIRDINSALAAGSEFDIWRFGDQTAGGPFGSVAVTYDFDESSWLLIEDAESGLDYAILHLRYLYRRNLEAGGIVALGKDAWSSHVAEHDYWVLIGIPSESVEYDGITQIKARFVMAPLLSAEEPALATGRSTNQFYAKAVDGSEQFFRNADGFSGGPVFALKKFGEQWQYCVIGVQSAWYRPTLAICPFESFALEIERIVTEAFEEAKAKELGVDGH